ncbi:MAG: hypothetical protein QOH63_1948 [Acidobacteriota bacterium]|jgi:hypothetical protein|nr:hypothetical protein [Acidobacteriota bacterium]
MAKPTLEEQRRIAIEAAVDRALISVPHPHPHGGHPENCARCHAREKLVALLVEPVNALRTVVRQIEGSHPVGHDAFLAARRALKKFDASIGQD